MRYVFFQNCREKQNQVTGMAGCIQPVPLQVNSGFCRVAIYEITNAKGGRQGINKDDRTTFQNMFADIPKFGLEEN